MITATDTAVTKIKELLSKEENPLPLRIAVVGGGCSGLSYKMGWDAQVDEDILAFDKDGVKIVVDKESMPHLTGSVIDFTDGLSGSGFKINNPNVTNSCGCGRSFS